MKRDTKPVVLLEYNLAQLLKQAIGAMREYTLNEDLQGIDPAITTTEPLTGKLKLVRTQDGALITLKGKTSIRVVCSRCLEPVDIAVALEFEEQFFQTVDVITGLPLGPSQDDPAVLIDSHHDLHMADIIREYLLLALPMQPLCREDCKGLCPTCGHNLNEGPCGHESGPVDERWGSLGELLSRK